MNILKYKVTIEEIYNSLLKDKCLICSKSIEKEEQLKTGNKIIIPLCPNHRIDAIGEKFADHEDQLNVQEVLE